MPRPAPAAATPPRLRNPTALTIQPGSGQLWAVVNERDELGANLVPDYLTSVRSRAF
jgi:glucose/arabinose dehydrogenase